MWAALTVAVLPNLIANDTFALDEPLALLLILFMVDCLLHRRWIWAGAAVGALNAHPTECAISSSSSLPCGSCSGSGGRRCCSLSSWLDSWLPRGLSETGCRSGLRPSRHPTASISAAIHGPPLSSGACSLIPSIALITISHRVLQFNEEKWNSYLEKSRRRQSRTTSDLTCRSWWFEIFAADFELKPSYNVGAESEDGRDLHIVNGTLWIFYLEVVVGAAGLFLRRENDAVRLLFIQAADLHRGQSLFIAVPRLRAPIDLTLAVGVGASPNGPERGSDGSRLTMLSIRRRCRPRQAARRQRAPRWRSLRPRSDGGSVASSAAAQIEPAFRPGRSADRSSGRG